MGGRREIAGNKKYPKFADMQVGETVVKGEFLREIEGRFGPQFEFMSEEGDIVVVNGNGQIKHKMQFIKEGQNIEIEYAGLIVLEAGAMKGKDCHQFKFFDLDDPEVEKEAEAEAGEEVDEFNDL